MSAIDHHPLSRALALLAGLAIAAPFSMGWAQAPSGATVTEADIERAHRSQPAITERDIERARRAHPSPSNADVTRVQSLPSPRIDALPQPETGTARPALDLGKLAEGFAAQASGQAQPSGLTSGPRLLVFISLSMPEATLKRLFHQAAQARATLVIRGLANDSLRDTFNRMQALNGSQRVAAQIDPQAFERYAVTRVPSFVVTQEADSATPCKNAQCAPATDFALVAGDVSLDYALTHIGQHASRFATDAGIFLQRLKR